MGCNFKSNYQYFFCYHSENTPGTSFAFNLRTSTSKTPNLRARVNMRLWYVALHNFKILLLARKLGLARGDRVSFIQYLAFTKIMLVVPVFASSSVFSFPQCHTCAAIHLIWEGFASAEQLWGYI